MRVQDLTEEQFNVVINDRKKFEAMCDDFYAKNDCKDFYQIMRVMLAHQYLGSQQIDVTFRQLAIDIIESPFGDGGEA